MTRAVLGAADLIIPSKCSEARAERYQEMATETNAEQLTTHTKTQETELLTQKFHAVRSKIFDFHSVRSVIIAKLKTKSNQR